jgi:uncharacterized protein (DUF488 family)
MTSAGGHRIGGHCCSIILSIEASWWLTDVRRASSVRASRPPLLAEAGIDYVHLPALGNPKNNRGPSQTGDPESRQRFRALLHDEIASQALDHIVGLLEDGAVAGLCCERSDEQCYRHLVAEAVLKARPSVELVAI